MSLSFSLRSAFHDALERKFSKLPPANPTGVNQPETAQATRTVEYAFGNGGHCSFCHARINPGAPVHRHGRLIRP